MSDQNQPSGFPPPGHPHQAPDNTASYGRRLGAFLLDGIFMMTALMLVIQHLGLTELSAQAANNPQAMQAELLTKMAALSDKQRFLLVVYPFLAFFVLHGYLLSRYGQTLGKRILGIAIVTLDNRVPAFFPLIAQRYLTQWLAGMVPGIGILLRLADILVIFRSDRRCIHDHLAKTKVIDLRIPVAFPPGAQGAPQANTLVV